MNLKKTSIVFVGAAISIVGLWFAFHDVNFSKVWESRTRIQWLPLVASIVVYWAGVVVARAFLIKYLLKTQGEVSFARIYRCLCIGFLANNTLPLRIGDVARSGAIAKGSDIPFSTVLGSMALERMLDMAMVALLAFAALQVAPLPGGVRAAATATGIAMGAGLLVLFFLARLKHGTNDSSATGVRRLWNFTWRLWIRFSHGFTALKSVRGVIAVIGLSLLIWGIGLVSIMLRLSSFELQGSLAAALVLFTCMGFAVALPSAPGYVGVFQAATVVALTSLGVDKEIAAAFALFSWIVDIAVGDLAGALSMIIEGTKFSELKGPAEKVQQT